MSRLVKNTTYITIATIGQKIIAFIYFALIARTVGVEFTGKYFLALSITTMVGVIADFGLTSVLVRDSAKYPDREKKILGNVIAAKIGLSVLAVLAAVMITNAFGHDLLTRQLVYMASAVMVLDTAHLTLYGVFRGRHKLSVESIGIFIGMAITATIGFVSLFTHPSLYILIIALLAGSTWNVVFAVIHLVRIGVRPWHIRFEKRFLKHLFKVAFPFALAAIFVKIYSTTDSLLLNHYLGSEGVGLYSVAYKLTYSFQFFPLAFIAALYPTFSAQVAKGDKKELNKTFEQAFWYMLLLAIPIVFGLWSVADDLIIAVYSVSYVDSIVPFRTLIFVLLFIFLDFPIGALLNADDRQSTKTAIMGGTMVINVVANILLIPHFGLLGACYAALISFVFLYVAGMYYVRTSIDYDIKRLAKIGLPILMSGLVMALAVVLIKPYLGLVASIPIGAIVYLAGLLATESIKIPQIKGLLKGFK